MLGIVRIDPATSRTSAPASFAATNVDGLDIDSAS